ncbi:alpha/beta fold hydrolase [Streptomyces sp. cf386]|uniref:alpha/beta fold hydrolase n=1 Tax=Streptomyces sp. cf386 TaxID=1761904 RepID=UPI00210B0285|nr:alpha/beta hydrolase [Streptomyces sp. cf386]
MSTPWNSPSPSTASHKNAATRSVSVLGENFAYRELGPKDGVPLILLVHLAGVLDNWDPRVVDGLAARRRVITFDNRGVGGSSGSTPGTIEAMARDAVLFIRALGFDQVDLFGLSMGGFIAQVIAAEEPHLVRKVILAGTGPAGGPGIDKVPALAIQAALKGALTRQDPKLFLFFTDTAGGRQAGREFLERLKERTHDRDKDISLPSFRAQLRPSSGGADRRRRTCPPFGSRPSWQTARSTGWYPARTHSTWPPACPRANSSPSTRMPGTEVSSSATTTSWPGCWSSSSPELEWLSQEWGLTARPRPSASRYGVAWCRRFAPQGSVELHSTRSVPTSVCSMGSFRPSMGTEAVVHEAPC